MVGSKFPMISKSQMRLESLPNMNRLVQSDITKYLVRQLTCLLKVESYIREEDNIFAAEYTKAKADTGEVTLHKQNTKATGNFDLSKPNLLEVELQSALLPVEQIDQNACTLNYISITLVSQQRHYSIPNTLALLYV